MPDGKYCSQTDVETLTQMQITNDTKPDSSQLDAWMQEIDAEVDARKLGWKDGGVPGDGYTITDTYIDVPAQVGHKRILTRNLETMMDSQNIPGVISVKIDGYYPLIAITSLSRRTSGLTDTPVWEAVTEGFYEGWVESSGADFRSVTTNGKCKQKHIIAIEFFGSKKPDAGAARLKGTFKYGWNIPEHILRRWATLAVGLRVLDAVALSGEPTRIAGYTRGDFQDYVNTQFANLANDWWREMLVIEADYFPEQPEEGTSILRI